LRLEEDFRPRYKRVVSCKDSSDGTDALAVSELPPRLTAGQLRTCKRPGCGRAFIAVKRQEHRIDCAKAVQKARVAAWRRRNAQRVRDLAHETYVRWIIKGPPGWKYG